MGRAMAPQEASPAEAPKEEPGADDEPVVAAPTTPTVASQRSRRPSLTGAERMARRKAAVQRHTAAQNARKKGRCADPVDAISVVGDNHWRVERSFVDGYTGDMERFNTLGAVGKHESRAGRADGFVLGRIQCGSPLHQGGLRNGDVVHAVNDRKVHNLLQALVAYNKLRNDSEITVDLTRRNGRHETLRYSVY